MGKTVNVVLKDKNGEAVTYTGIDTVKLATDTGETAAFTLGGGVSTLAKPVFKIETVNGDDNKMRIRLENGSWLEKELDAGAIVEGVDELFKLFSGEDGDLSKLTKAVDKKLLGALFAKLKSNLGKGTRYPKYTLHLHIPAESVKSFFGQLWFILPGLDLDKMDEECDKILDAWNAFAQGAEDYQSNELISWILEMVPELIMQAKDFFAQPGALEALDLSLPTVPTSWSGLVNTILTVLAQPGVSVDDTDARTLIKVALESVLDGLCGSYVPSVLARKAVGELAAVDALKQIPTLNDIAMLIKATLSTPGVYIEFLAISSEEDGVPSERSNSLKVSRAMLEYGDEFAETKIFEVNNETFSDDGNMQSKDKLVFKLPDNDFMIDSDEDQKNLGEWAESGGFSGTYITSFNSNNIKRYWSREFWLTNTDSTSGTKKYEIKLASNSLPEGAIWYLYDANSNKIIDIARVDNAGCSLGAELKWDTSNSVYYYLRFVGCDGYSGDSVSVTFTPVDSLDGITDTRDALGYMTAKQKLQNLSKATIDSLDGFVGAVAWYDYRLGNLNFKILADDEDVYFLVNNTKAQKESSVKAKLLNADSILVGSVELTDIGTENENAGEGSVCNTYISGKYWKMAGAVTKAILSDCTLEITIGEKTQYKAFYRNDATILDGTGYMAEKISGVHDAENNVITLNTTQAGFYIALENEPEQTEKPVLRYVIEQSASGNIVSAGLKDSTNADDATYISYADGKPCCIGLNNIAVLPGMHDYTAAAFSEGKVLSEVSDPVRLGVFHLGTLTTSEDNDSETFADAGRVVCVENPVLKTPENETVLTGEQWLQFSEDGNTINLLNDGNVLVPMPDGGMLTKTSCASHSLLDRIATTMNMNIFGHKFNDDYVLHEGTKEYTGSVSVTKTEVDGTNVEMIVLKKPAEDLFIHIMKSSQTKTNSETTDTATE